jgi:hypothetical protein
MVDLDEKFWFYKMEEMVGGGKEKGTCEREKKAISSEIVTADVSSR